MAGTILSNFWVALLAFSASFFSSYPFLDRMTILFNSSVLAITFFVLTFLARALIGYIMENPIDIVEEMIITTPSITGETEIPSEKYAEIVKTMLKDE